MRKPTACHATFAALLLVVTITVGPAAPLQADDAPAEGVFVEHRLILEEPNGGTDSSVSPDGNWLAYSSRRGGNLDVWVANIETGETRQITDNPATDNEPRWHPDGTKLCFVTQRDGSQDVYVVDLETRKETPIATKPFNEDYPSFSRDGSEICFTGGPRGFREVQIYNFESDEIRTLTRGYGYVGSTNFSPDGKQVIFHAYYDNSYNSGKSDLFVVPAAGGKPRNVSKERHTWDYKPNWSFDGEWITYSSRRTTPNFNLWLMRPDGSDKQPITNVAEVDLRWSNWTRDGRIGWHQVNRQTGRLRAIDLASGEISDLHVSDFNINELSSSPDKRSLVYETDARIHVVDAHPGAEPQQLTIGLKPRWNRDGSEISYLRFGGTKIGLVPRAGGEPRFLDVKPADWPNASANAWSPDGEHVAVVTAEDDLQVLKIVARDGTQRRLHESLDPITSPLWSDDGQAVLFAENHPPSVGYYISTEAVVPAIKQAATVKQPPRIPDGGGERFSATDFELSDLDGEAQRLSDFKDPVVLLYFWSTYRECEADLRLLQDLYEKYAHQGVAIIGLCYSSGTREQVSEFLESNGIDFPNLMCSQQVCDDYAVATFPTSFLLDSERRVHYWMYGILVGEHWDQLVAEMLQRQSGR